MDIAEIFKKNIFPIMRNIETGYIVVIDDANREV